MTLSLYGSLKIDFSSINLQYTSDSYHNTVDNYVALKLNIFQFCFLCQEVLPKYFIFFGRLVVKQ